MEQIQIKDVGLRNIKIAHKAFSVLTATKKPISNIEILKTNYSFKAEENPIEKLFIYNREFHLTQIGNYQHPILGTDMVIYKANEVTKTQYRDADDELVVEESEIGDIIIITESMSNFDIENIADNATLPISLIFSNADLVAGGDVFTDNGVIKPTRTIKENQLSIEVSISTIRPSTRVGMGPQYLEIMPGDDNFGFTNFGYVLSIKLGTVSDISDDLVPATVINLEAGLTAIPAKSQESSTPVYIFAKV